MNLNTRIARMSKTKKVNGDVGIEIECETKKAINDPYYSDFWMLHNDGSLRGHGYEFVLSKPIEIKDTGRALKEWAGFVQKTGVQFVDSKRASVHVHVNVQDKRIIDVINILCAYWLIEPLLLNIAGEERKGNLFCLGINCADTVHQQLVKNLKDGSFFQRFSRDAYRYASVNLEALYKFGSLEFRTLRGTQDIKLIEAWTTELHSLVTRAGDYKSPHGMVELISAGKHKKFLRSLFSESFVDRLITESGHKWRNLINENLPLVLDILAARDEWDPKADEAAEKKRYQEQLKADGTEDDHRNDERWWPERGRFNGPIILGAEVGLVQNRIVDRNRDERSWCVWDGRSWRPITTDEFNRTIHAGGGFRLLPDTPVHPTAVRDRRRQLVQEGELPDIEPEATIQIAPGTVATLRGIEARPVRGRPAAGMIVDDLVDFRAARDEWANPNFNLTAQELLQAALRQPMPTIGVQEEEGNTPNNEP